MPNSRKISRATRSLVHNSPLKPKACAPCKSRESNRVRCSVFSLGGAPLALLLFAQGCQTLVAHTFENLANPPLSQSDPLGNDGLFGALLVQFQHAEASL